MKTIRTIATFSALGCAAATAAQERPNVLLIITDQQRWDMVSALHESEFFSTPNIDRLARRGCCFDNTYCANPISVPSRWALFTGESTACFGIQDNTAPHSRKDDLLEVARTRSLGALFRQAGYRNYYAGKSHLPFGEGRSPGGDKAVNWQFDHLTKDDRLGAVEASEAFFRNFRPDGRPFLFVVSLINPHDIGADKLVVVDNPRPEDNPQSVKPAGINALTYLPRIRELGDDYFRSDASGRLPSNFGPTDHHPQESVFRKGYGSYSELMWKKYIWFYHRLVEQVDAEIGRVLDAFENSPCAENTVVVFTSDHGDMMASHGLGKKNIMYGECQRVPLILAGPGVQPRIDRTTPVCNGWDLVPTLCGVAGVPVPEQLDGVSLWDYACGRESAVRREHLYLEGSNAFEIIQDGRWAYVLYEMPGNPAVLFDLENDPGQLHNLAPDPAYAAKVGELRRILDQELKKRGLTLSDNRPYSISGLVKNRK